MRKLINHCIIFCLSLLLTACHHRADIHSQTGSTGVQIIEQFGEPPISQIAEDDYGHTWLNAGHSLYCFDGYKYISYLPDSQIPSSIASRNIECILTDSQSRVWVGTQTGIDLLQDNQLGFNHFSTGDIQKPIEGLIESPDGVIYAWSGKEFFKYDNKETFIPCLKIQSESNISYAEIDSNGKIWLASGKCVECFDPSFKKIQEISLPGIIEGMALDKNGGIYILSNGKARIYDTRDFSQLPSPRDMKQMDGIYLQEICKYGQCLLLRSDTSLFCIDSFTQKIQSSLSGDLPFELQEELSTISSIHGDAKGNLWISFKQGGFRKVLPTDATQSYTKLFAKLADQEIVALTFNSDYIWTILENENLVSYNIQSHDFSSITELPQFESEQQNRIILKMYPLQDGRIAITCINDIYIYKTTSEGNLVPDAFTSFMDADLFMPQLVLGSDGNFWCAGKGPVILQAQADIHGELDFKEAATITGKANTSATKGIVLHNGDICFAYSDIGLVFIHPEDGCLKTIELPEAKEHINVSSMVEDSDHNLWIGTIGSGLLKYDLETETFENISAFDKQRIWDILDNGSGNLYVQAENAIFLSDINKTNFEQIWSFGDVISGPRHVFLLPEGWIVINDEHGTIHFQDNSGQHTNMEKGVRAVLSSEMNVMALLDDDDLISGKTVIQLDEMPGDLILNLSLASQQKKKLTLSYRVNSKSWQHVFNQTLPIYGLHFGMNKIHLYLMDPILGDTSNDYLIHIKIRRPLYQWGILFLFCILIATFIYLLRQRNNKKQEAETAKREKVLQEEINMHNIDFFANISHEFRTPLALIDGAVDSLASSKIPSEQYRMQQVIRRNTDRMLKLVGQLLDFNKLDHDMLQLNVNIADAKALINKIVEQFRFGASSKNINLDLDTDCTPIPMWLDSDKMEKILYNLLSNALKFTSPSGTISVHTNIINDTAAKSEFGITPVDGEDKFLRVDICDTGVGIPESKLTFIFERFAQVDSTHKTGGTGIGLYFTKSLVELHHGRIKADNRHDLPENKTGAIFSFAIPMDACSYSEAEKHAPTDNMVSAEDNRTQSEYLVRERPVEKNNNKPSIVVIDDDYEMVYYLKELLSSNYQVNFRYDAMSGYQVIEQVQPDLIISDVMMVETDGLQLCRMVKENIDTCHIPVILLTAKSTMEDQIQGLNIGADAYITKPFNRDYLLAMIKSLLENRRLVRKMLNTITRPQNIESKSLAPIDHDIMTSLYTLMESSLENGELNADDMAAQLGISRTKFYAKIKALTGQTPNDFFNVYRLNRAAELIREGKYKISAIADIVGFNSASYFTSLFKKQFGMLPSEYLESLKNN